MIPIFFFSCSNESSKLDWIEGHWTMEEGSLITHEVWEQTADSEWSGLGYSMDGEDSVFVERMRIFEIRDTFFFEVYLPNALAPKYFRNTSTKEGELNFFWPENDFPTNIIYRAEGDSLFATLLGEDGREVDLKFAKQ